jgi:hypothetical protein
MRLRLPALLLGFGCALGWSTPAAAQSGGELVPPPFIGRLDGQALLIRNAATEDALLNAPLLEGDRLELRNGRAAVQWPDGLLLAIDTGGVVDLLELRSVRLVRGRFVVLAPTQVDSSGLRVVTTNAAVDVLEPGRYGITVGSLDSDWQPFMGLDVEAGTATLTSEGGELTLITGQYAAVRGTDAPRLEASPVAAGAFRAWADAAAGDVTAASASARYLPSDLQLYGATLDRHGSWDFDVSAGWVWYPQVDVQWRPYSVGVWVHAGRYGWFWAGGDPWAWPTHHFGRWGMSSHGRWYWRPHQRWAPAWVSWAVGPGYISWCPLDWSGRPLFAAPFSVGVAVRRPRFDPWRGWVTVPSRAFGGRTPVHRAAIDGRHLPDAERRAFVTQPVGPPRVQGRLTVAGGALGRARLRSPTDRPATRDPVSADVARRWPARERDHPAFAPDPYAGPRASGRDHPVFRAPGATWGSVARPRTNTSPYSRPTPFVNPRWTSDDGASSVGLPRLQPPERQDRPALPARGLAVPRAGPREPAAGRPQPAAPRAGRSTSGAAAPQRVPPSARSGQARPRR